MRRVATFALLAVLALPGSAAAAVHVVAPPGASEADQYFETVPASTGPRAPNGERKEEDAVRDGSISPATGRALQRRGPAGQAVAALVADTAPAASETATGRGGRSGRAAAKPTLPPASAPGKAGMGAVFPLALAAVAVAAVAFAVARRRRPVAR
jgi:hypothetical protein